MTHLLRKTDFYPIVDRAPLMRLLVSNDAAPKQNWMATSNYKARWTGEHRCPRKGEWYLSGSYIECYYAPNDLSSPYHIAEICEVEEVKTLTVKRTF